MLNKTYNLKGSYWRAQKRTHYSFITLYGPSIFKLYKNTTLFRLQLKPLSKTPKMFFQDRLSLNAGQTYCRMLQREHSAIFRPSLSYHVSFIQTFVLSILSDRFTQVLLYCVFSFLRLHQTKKTINYISSLSAA